MGNNDWFYSLDGSQDQYWNGFGDSLVATCKTSDGTLVSSDGNGVGAEVRIRLEPAIGPNSNPAYPPNTRWKLLEVVNPGTGFTAGAELQCYFNTDRRLALGLPNTAMQSLGPFGNLRIGQVSSGQSYPYNSRLRVESFIEAGTGYAVGDILNFSINTSRRINIRL